MTTVHQVPLDSDCDSDDPVECLPSYLPDAPYMAMVKGSVDGLMTVSTRVLDNGDIKELTPAYRERIIQANDGLAADGMRVLGMAHSAHGSATDQDYRGKCRAAI